MGKTDNLLDTIEARARQGNFLAVVRVLRETPANSATFAVFDDEVVPTLEDHQVNDLILSSVRTLVDSGIATSLVDAVDRKGSPIRLAIEVVKPKVELIIFGAGHVGQATALIAAIMGYDVTVIDDRQEFASRSRFPDSRIQLMACDYASAAHTLNISTSTAVVIVTRGHQYDELCLKSVIDSRASYIGMIGSRKRVLSVFKKLTSEGASERALEKVHAPIGLRIGARSPQEIAVSILAEIIDHMNSPEHKDQGE